jgi:hypothetical protein
MSGSTGDKIGVIVLFLLIGVPTGLCSTLASPFILSEFFSLRFLADSEAFMSALMLLLVWLLGFAIAFFLLRWLNHVFRA